MVQREWDLTKDDECHIFFLISWNVKYDEVVNIFSRAKGQYFSISLIWWHNILPTLLQFLFFFEAICILELLYVEENYSYHTACSLNAMFTQYKVLQTDISKFLWKLGTEIYFMWYVWIIFFLDLTFNLELIHFSWSSGKLIVQSSEFPQNTASGLHPMVKWEKRHFSW